MPSRPTAVILRPRRPSDDLSIGALGRSAFGAYTVDAARAVRAMIREPNTRTEVATIDDEPVGVIVIRFDYSAGPFGPFERPAVARLNAIAVQPQLRGRGLGRQLLSHGERLAQTNGAVSLSLMTASGNSAARSLFESAGYLYLATIGGAYVRREPALLMIKPLAC